MTGPRWPGWYRDPRDPTLLRHWSGRHWDGRRRHLPSWAISTDALELLDPSVAPSPEGGPASRAVIPAAATPRARAGPAHPSARRAGTGTRPSFGPTDWPSRGAVARGSLRRALPRRRALAATLVLALLVVTVSSALSGAGRRRQGVASAETAFAQEANTACAATMGGIRSATAVTASLQAVRLGTAELDRLGRRLELLASPAELGGAVRKWVGDWRAWAGARLAVAEPTLATRRLSTSRVDELTMAAAVDAQRADGYASGHGLSDCLLASGDVPAVLPVP